MAQSELTNTNSPILESILVFTTQDYSWIGTLLETYSQVNNVVAEGDLIRSLLENTYTVVILDETIIGSDIENLIREIRDRFPILVTIVLSMVSPKERQNLFDVGADDVIDTTITSE